MDRQTPAPKKKNDFQGIEIERNLLDTALTNKMAKATDLDKFKGLTDAEKKRVLTFAESVNATLSEAYNYFYYYNLKNGLVVELAYHWYKKVFGDNGYRVESFLIGMNDKFSWKSLTAQEYEQGDNKAYPFSITFNDKKLTIKNIRGVAFNMMTPNGQIIYPKWVEVEQIQKNINYSTNKSADSIYIKHTETMILKCAFKVLFKSWRNYLTAPTQTYDGITLQNNYSNVESVGDSGGDNFEALGDYDEPATNTNIAIAVEDEPAFNDVQVSSNKITEGNFNSEVSVVWEAVSKLPAPQANKIVERLIAIGFLVATETEGTRTIYDLPADVEVSELTMAVNKLVQSHGK